MLRRNLIHGMLATVTLTGCAPDSFGEFEVADVQKHAECLDDVFPFEPLFLAARARAKSAGLFFQSRGGTYQFVDTLYIEVYDPDPAGSTLTFSKPGSSLDLAMVGEFEPSENCPDLIESMYLEGQVRFDAFDVSQDGLVEGELMGVSIRSGRDGAVVAGSLSGNFTIEVRRGQPYEEIQVFPP